MKFKDSYHCAHAAFDGKGLEARAVKIGDEKRCSQYMSNNVRRFIVTMNRADFISEFSPETWAVLVEIATIKAKDDIRFYFRNDMSL